ncbi:tetratricopeptide repeat protein [Hymenobacter chitinivorans]|uniref:Tetratricopeptide repeat protein n=1 Tax=Hymenobacter chitinivorans DSM 11115 TaxID=1121954 RepID=A0A2M9BNQ0_9BACT|nr:tetratricopeptide repeat protein [Hymenobacter chitinivorans]PJJ59566.1 tetratricopeptide repeat protein [Hymenobacter chitinivorans DSM 11115]
MRYPSSKLLVVLLLAGLTATAQAQAPDEVKALIKQGVTLYDEGKYDEAVLRYKQALKLAPDDFTAQYELAMTYGSLGRNEEVVELCQRLLKGEPADPNVYITYGTALDDLKKPQEAIRIYQTGLKKFPDNGLLYYNLGVTQAGVQRYEEATESMQLAVRKNPRHASAHRTLALLTAQSNRVPAVFACVRFLQLEPRSPRATGGLELLDKLMGKGVRKTGDKAVTLSMTPDMLKQVNGKKNQPDNFGQADMLLTMASAHDYDDKNKDKSATVRLAEKLTSLCQSLEEQKEASHPGFAWNYYVPYFLTLKKAGYLPTLTYLIQAARPGQPEAQQWLDQHPSEVKEFQEWSEAYKW